MKTINILLTILLMINLLGCVAILGDLSTDRPEWIKKAGGVYKGKDGSMAIFAVGSYKIRSNYHETIESARAKARNELSSVLTAHVQNMLTGADREALDLDASDLLEMKEVSLLVSNAVLIRSRQIYAYEDFKKERYYVLLRMDLDKGFLEEVRDTMIAACRNKTAK